MDLLRSVTPYVTGTSEHLGGSGDPSPATAWGVFHAMGAVAERLWGDPSLDGPPRRGARRRQGRRARWPATSTRPAPASPSPTSAPTPSPPWPPSSAPTVVDPDDALARRVRRAARRAPSAPCSSAATIPRAAVRGGVRRRQQPAGHRRRRRAARRRRRPLRPRLRRERRRRHQHRRRDGAGRLRPRPGLAPGRGHRRHAAAGVRRSPTSTGSPPAAAADRLAEERLAAAAPLSPRRGSRGRGRSRAGGTAMPARPRIAVDGAAAVDDRDERAPARRRRLATTAAASSIDTPRVMASSVITTRSPGSRAPAIRPPAPWSLSSLRTLKLRSIRPRVAATPATPKATASAPIVSPPMAVTSSGSTARSGVGDEQHPVGPARRLLGVDEPVARACRTSG